MESQDQDAAPDAAPNQTQDQPQPQEPQEGQGGSRLQRFHVLYREVLAADFDLDEFAVDALYAFQVIERALRSEAPELRNLAAHVQLEVESGIESITIRAIEPPEAMGVTRKMQVLREDEAAPVEMRPVPDRRAARAAVAPATIETAGHLLGLYVQEFGRAFDIDEFVENDLYGRAVLRQIGLSGNAELIAAASPFLDEQGRPRRHRRRAAAPHVAL